MLLTLVEVWPCIVITSPFTFVLYDALPNVLDPPVAEFVPKFILTIGSIIWLVKAKVPVPLGMVWVLSVERFVIVPLLKSFVPLALNSVSVLSNLIFPAFADNLKSFPDIILETKKSPRKLPTDPIFALLLSLKLIRAFEVDVAVVDFKIISPFVKFTLSVNVLPDIDVVDVGVNVVAIVPVEVSYVIGLVAVKFGISLVNANVPLLDGVVIDAELPPVNDVMVLLVKVSVDDFVKLVEITSLLITNGKVAVNVWPTKFASTYLTILPVALSAINIKSLLFTEVAWVVFDLNAKLTFACVVFDCCSTSVASPLAKAVFTYTFVVVSLPPKPFNDLIIYISNILYFL